MRRIAVFLVALGVFALPDAAAGAQDAPVVEVSVAPDVEVVRIDRSGGGAVVQPPSVTYDVQVRNPTDGAVDDVAVVVLLPSGEVVTRSTGALGAAGIWRETFAVAVDAAAPAGRLVVAATATPAGGNAVSASGGPQVEVPIASAARAPSAEVLGVTRERGELPRTGSVDVRSFVVVALMLLVLGAVAVVVVE